MKSILALSLLMYAPFGFAYPKKGECAAVAAEAARVYAAKHWDTSVYNLNIKFSNISPSSNPPPVQIYDVGITRKGGEGLVQFDVGLDYVNGSCENVEVRFAEFVD